MRKMLRNDQWERIEHLLPGKAGDRGVTAEDNRLFVEAVLWIARTGSPWRDLPPQLGNWHNVCIRASRAGARAACGSELSRQYARMRIWKRSCWTAPSFVPTSMLPAVVSNYSNDSSQ